MSVSNERAQPILVPGAITKALLSLLGGFSCLSPTLSCGVAFARSREPLRWRLITAPHSLSWPEIQSQCSRTVEKGITMPTQTISSAGPKIRTKMPGPNAQKILANDAKYISPSYTRSYPLVVKRGRGVVIEDVDGNEFLDFSSGIAVCSTGHCHPEVVAAIQKQAGELIHMSGTDFYYENLVTLAERLSKIAPMPGPHKFYYGNSGAEAIEAALKLARYHTRRQQVIAFYGCFHGRTMGALSLTASKPQQRRRFAPLMPGVTHVPFPDPYHRPAGTDAKQYAIDCARFIENTLFQTALAP